MKIIKSAISPLLSLAQTQTAKNTYLNFLAYFINGIIILIFNIVCSRSLGPSTYGIFSLAIALYIIIFDVFGLGIDQGMIRFIAFFSSKEKTSKANAYAKFGFLFRIFFGAFVTIIGFCLSGFIAQNIFRLPQLATPLRIVFVGEFGLGLLSWLVRFSMAQQNFFKVALFETTKGVLRLFFLAALFLAAKINLFWTVIIFTLTPSLAFTLGFITISKKFLKAKITRQVVNRLIHFSKWIFIWAATATFHGRVELLMLARTKGSFATGIYSVASGLMIGFVWIITAFSNVLAPKLSQISTQNQFVKIIKKSLVAVFGLLLSIAAAFSLAKPIIIVLFSSVYEEAIPVFQLLCVGLIFFALNTPFMSSLYAIGKSKSIALLSILQLLLLILINLFAIPAFGIKGPAITFIIVNWIILTLTIFLVFSRLKKGKLYSK